jgi:hypothetical protein
MTPTATATATPARYGRAYREIVATALTLTEDELAAVKIADTADAEEIYERAVQNVDLGLALIDGVDDPILDGYPPCVIDAVVAVLARDRGLVTTADFDIITAPWVAAGLPLPHAVTGDDDTGAFTPLADMTTDRLADALLQAAFADQDRPQIYGAVLLLTGYNQGELLAFDSVREYLDLHDGRLKLDWESLCGHLDHGDFSDDDMDASALRALNAAADLSVHDDDDPNDVHFDFGTPDNVEALVFAFGYAVGGEAALNPYDPDITPDLANPVPRQVRSEPTS